MQLENHISELLLRHNCLIIPGFGGFVARYSPAKIDWTKGVVSPPSKELLFNKHLVQNDGLFVNHIALSESFSFEDALKHIDNKVQSWKVLLQSGGRVEIEKVGLLYHDFNGNIVFEQDRFFNLLLSSFGLKEVTFIAEKAVTKIENEIQNSEIEQPVLVPFETVNKDKISIPQQEKETPVIPLHSEHNRKSKFNWKYLAVAALIPFGFFAYWIPMKTDVLHSGKVALADFNPFRTIPSSIYAVEKLNAPQVEEELHYSWEDLTKDLPKEIEVFNYRFSEDLYIPVRLLVKDKTSVVSTTSENVTNPSKPVVVDNNQFFLIAGCFGNKTNAENLVAELITKGFNAQILDVNKGLHRVSISGHSSHQLAAQEMNNLSSQGISTWVLRK